MANRYWVGGTDNWDGTAGTKWAATSGGLGGQSVPTTGDAVFFDNNSGTGTITISAGNTGAQSLNCTGFTGTITGSANITISQNITLVSGMTFSHTGTISINSASTITSAGQTFGSISKITSTALTLTLADALTCSGTCNLSAGTLSLGSYTLTCSAFNSSTTASRTIAFGTGNITVTGTGASWNTGTSINLTVTGTPTVNFTYSGTSTLSASVGNLSQANSINFNFTAGTYNLSFLNSSNNSARNVNFTGYSGVWGTTSTDVVIYGNLTLSSGMTVASGAGFVSFGATSGIQEITSAGRTFGRNISVNGVGGTVKLLDNLTLNSIREFRQTNGTLDLNGKTLTVGSTYSTAAGTKNLTFNGGTLVCPNSGATAFNNAAPTGYTTTAGTGTGKISMTSASAKTFVGGGSIFNCTLSNDGAGALTITGSNTFTTLANGVQPTSFLFTAGTTTTLTNWNISGTADNLVTIGSVTAAPHTLLKSSGNVTANFLTISNSAATGGATWNQGPNSFDGGNNFGWVFGRFFQLFY